MLIEETVKNHLDSYFAELGISVSLEIPKPMPDKFIVFQKIDSGRTDHIEAATIEIHSYAGNKYDAATLDEQVREAMDELNESSVTTSYGGGGDSFDTTLKMPRYRCYYNLYY